MTLNHGRYKAFSELADNEVNRVSLPGDVDYKKITLANGSEIAAGISAEDVSDKALAEANPC